MTMILRKMAEIRRMRRMPRMKEIKDTKLWFKFQTPLEIRIEVWLIENFYKMYFHILLQTSNIFMYKCMYEKGSCTPWWQFWYSSPHIQRPLRKSKDAQTQSSVLIAGRWNIGIPVVILIVYKYCDQWTNLQAPDPIRWRSWGQLLPRWSN